MRIYLPLLAAALAVSFISVAQKPVLTYPFKFTHGFQGVTNNGVAFYVDQTVDNVALVLHDLKKADYVMTDKDMKVVNHFSLSLDNTIFKGTQGDQKYLGGSSNGKGLYNFVYDIFGQPVMMMGGGEHFRIETVNFNDGTVSQKDFVKKSEGRNQVLGLSDGGKFYFMSADDAHDALVVHVLNDDGSIAEKSIPFPIPQSAGRKRNSVSEYLKETKAVKEDEEAEMETATRSSKCFITKDNFVFVVNDHSSPTHIITINKGSLALTERFIDHSAITGDEKDKADINSFIMDDKIFSLSVSRKALRIGVYDGASGKALKTIEMTEENYTKLLSVQPEETIRKGSKEDEKDLDDYKALLKELDKRTSGILVTKTPDGRYKITIGTYDHIVERTSSGGGITTGISTVPGGTAGSIATGGATYFVSNYVPGISTYTTGGSNYFRTATCTMLLDPATLAPVKGKVRPSPGTQIKDFMDNRDGTMRRQFSIGGKEYFGYYNKDNEAYEVVNIPLKK